MNRVDCCIGIRADGNTQLGMGHLMRCRTIALQIVKRGCRVVFFTAEETAGQLIREWGFPVLVLGSDYRNMEEELPILLEGLEKEAVRLLLVDSYQVTSNYLQQLTKRQQVFLMDDMGEELYPVSGVINYNIYGEELFYKERYGEATKLLLGSSFAPVRDEFVGRAYSVKKDVEHILITMGGSDMYNIAGRLAHRLLAQVDGAELELVCGAFSPHLEELKALAAEEARVHVHVNVQHMAELMETCDLAISAAGSTMYELCAMGVPAVTCYYVDNQRLIAHSFGEKTLVYNAGDFAKEPEAVMENMIARVREMLYQPRLRAEISASMRQVVDGNGAGRIAEELIGLCE